MRRQGDLRLSAFAVRQNQGRVWMDSILGPPVDRSPGSGDTRNTSNTSSRSRSRSGGRHGRLGLTLWERVTRAFLAPDVLAVDADSIGTESRLASVTGATDSHTDGLAHALNCHVARGFPFARLEAKSVFGE